MLPETAATQFASEVTNMAVIKKIFWSMEVDIRIQFFPL